MNKSASTLLIERARGIADEIRDRAVEIDSANKLPDDLVRKFIDNDLVSVLVPQRFGGGEQSFGTAIEIIKTVAEADLAAAWVLAFYIGHNWIHCQFPEAGQEEIFANGPSPCSAGVLSPQLKMQLVDGGYRVSGRSSWNSGSPHADWIMGAGMLFDGETPIGPMCIIAPVSDLEIIDNWDVQGMRGTGSWDVVYNDVFVPERRGLDVVGLMNGDTPGSKIHSNGFYSRPLTPIVFAYCIAAFVGALRGATNELARLTPNRIGTNDKKAVKEKPTAHMRMGRAETEHYVASLMLDDMVGFLESDDAANTDVKERLAIKSRAATVAQICKNGIGDAVAGAGANAFRTDSPLQSAFRNINMISLHAFFDYDATTEAFGRALLGLDPKTAV